MNEKTAISQLAYGVATAAANKLMGDVWDGRWHPNLRVKVELSIDELRCAHFVHTGRAPRWWLNLPEIQKEERKSVANKPTQQERSQANE